MNNIFNLNESEKNRIRKLHECGVCDKMSGTEDDDGMHMMPDGTVMKDSDMDVIVIDTPGYEEVGEEMSIGDRIAEIEHHLSAIRAEQGKL